MKSFFDGLGALSGRIAAQPVSLFLDFDGTLAPIADTPDQAILPGQVKDILLKLSKLPEVRLAIVSGRALADVRHKVGINGLIYVGNHGYEIRGGGMEFEGLISPAYKKTLTIIKGAIGEMLADFPGAFLEDKGMTISVHYRLTQEDHHQIVGQLDKITKPFVIEKEIFIAIGKKVYEVKPPIDWGKGNAVLWILKRQQSGQEGAKWLPVYIGDDTTDENAFAAIGDKGITVCVGKKDNSNAKYYVDSTDDVFKFLKFLYEEKQHV